MHDDKVTYRKALEDFHRFRSKAAMDRFWAGIRGESLDLLPYSEVSSKLRAVSRTDLGLKEVPLKNIIGSVNRTDDFDRNFRPLSDADDRRWANVKTAMTSPFSRGVPPVSLYKIGDAYFVLDGNHRVSIAKEMGMDTIEAYVTEVKSKVGLSSSFTLEELVEKAALADFLEETHIDQILPGIDLSLKQIDNYPLLREHINVHQYYMGIDNNREIGYAEAVADWYDKIYTPVVNEIEKSGLYDEYPHLTLTDLYLLVLDKQHNLKESMGMDFKTENVIEFVAEQEGHQTKTSDSGANEELNKIALGEEEQTDDRLFRDIMVAISDLDTENVAVHQAILMNRSRDGSILGVHVLPEKQVSNDYVDAMESNFYDQLNQQHMKGKFISVTGETNRKLREFSLLSDLMVLRLRFPPGGSVIERASSGIIRILQRGRRPVLFVKDDARSVSRILLLYDEQEKSKEAFFIAAYYAARYQCSLLLINIEKSADSNQENLQFARDYLSEVNVEATIIHISEDEVIERLPDWIQDFEISTVMMRGYESSGLIGRLFASHVDRVLEAVSIPVLICQ